LKAILVDHPGGPEVLCYGDAPDPVPGADELLVRVRASAVNRADILQRRGGYAPPPGASPILGLEVAGEVQKAADGWKVGDRVMAVVTGGGYAELATVPAKVAMRIPAQFNYEQAAAISEAFLTAYLNLFTMGRLKAGETVLIHAGASGIGTAAIQLAKAAGARVIATGGSEDKLARCRELGAAIAINYKKEAFGPAVLEATDGRGADVILDFVGAPYWEGNMIAAAPHGRLLLIGFLGGSSASMDIGPIMTKNLTVTGTTLRRYALPKKIALVRAFSRFAMPRFRRGELRPVIDKVFPLSQASAAHQYVESNRNVGKVVLAV
jgi:tumor protein p53-inducible protein 3